MKSLIFIFILPILAYSQEYKTTWKNMLSGEKMGVINVTTNKEVVPFIYDRVIMVDKNTYLVQKGKLFGAVDTNNIIILQIKYDGINGYSEDVFNVSKGGKLGYTLRGGKEIVPCKFDEILNCVGGLLVAYTNNFVSTGYEKVSKDINGNIVDRTEIVSKGNIPVVFNKKGQIVYSGKPKETIETNINSNVFIVRSWSIGTKVINRNGAIMVPYKQGYFCSISEDGYVSTTAESGHGFLDLDGIERLKPNFSRIEKMVGKDFIKVYFSNKEYFYVNLLGVCVEIENVKCPQ